MRHILKASIVLSLFVSVFAFLIGMTPKPTSKKSLSRNFRLVMRQLSCDKTTESGADEVYCLVLGQKSNSQQYFYREPSPYQHWDMNDGDQGTDNMNGDSRTITNKTVFFGDLADGESWSINLILSEEDGGTTQNYQEKAAEMLVSTGNPYAAAGGAILGAMSALGFNITDTDDWMGMVGAQVTNNGGVLNIEWNGKDGVYESGYWETAPGNNNAMRFRMNHDDSNYGMWLELQGN